MAGEHAENVLPPKYPDGEEGQNENETPAPTQEQKPAENLPALGKDSYLFESSQIVNFYKLK